MSLWRWLIDTPMTPLSKHWLADTTRLSGYAEWTERQREGCVVKDSAWFQREAFWEAQAVKTESRKLKVISGRFQ